MLRSLTLTNWKSFGEERNTLVLAPLTLLVGPNASGKSNALDAIRFLQGAALDFPLGEVLRGHWEGQREVWPAIRGQVIEAARGTRRQFAIKTAWTLPGSPSLEHVIGIDTIADAVLDGERLTGADAAAFDTDAAALSDASGRQHDGTIRAALRSTGGDRAEERIYSAARSLLGQVTEDGRIHAGAIHDARQVQSALRRISFLDIQPARMRDYKPERALVLGSSAENISPKLRSMTQDQRDDVVAWLSELCAPALTGISFDTTLLKEVMFFLEEGGETKISARSVSDGTLRFLGLVTALITAEPGSTIVLEEPDVGLHPSRIHLLAQLLEQTTHDGRVQVLATTHSPTLLAHLSAASLANVVALGRAPDGVSICGRLGELQHFATLRDSQQLDRLVSTGWIERAL